MSTSVLARQASDLSVLRAAGLAACAARSSETFAYKLYPGPLRPASELAIVRLGDAQTVEIDGRTVLHADWTEEAVGGRVVAGKPKP
jgi:hypothetical protein